MKLWRMWAKALAEKASSDSDEADRIALIRTLIVGVNFITHHHGEYDPPLVALAVSEWSTRCNATHIDTRSHC